MDNSSIVYFILNCVCKCGTVCGFMRVSKVLMEARRGRQISQNLSCRCCELPSMSAGSQTPVLYKSNKFWKSLSHSSTSNSCMEKGTQNLQSLIKAMLTVSEVQGVRKSCVTPIDMWCVQSEKWQVGLSALLTFKNDLKVVSQAFFHAQHIVRKHN